MKLKAAGGSARLAIGLCALALAATPTPAGMEGATVPASAEAEVVPPEVQVKSQRTPLYPAAARAARVSGAVVVEATIDVEGKVGAATAIACSHPGLGFEAAAVDAVLQWKFRPALHRGEPVEYTTRFRLYFGQNAQALYGSMSLTTMREAPATRDAAVRRPSASGGDRNAKGATVSRR
jgi:protein TonB